MGQLGLQRLDELQVPHIHIYVTRIHGRHLLVRVSIVTVGHDVSGINHTRQPVLGDTDGGHHIQSQQRQVGEIVPGQRAVFQMGVNTPEPLEPAGCGAVFT